MLELSQSPTVVSDELARRLIEQQLCRPADFRRARACVHRLARDLPAFDSVWIDALVQLRRLTHYQARILDSGSAEQLRLGPYVIVDKLGHGPHGTTFLAKLPGQRDECVLKRLELAAESIPDCRTRLLKLQEQSHEWTHPHLVIPRLMEPGNEHQLVTISRRVAGLTLGDLLVRRGRFPNSIVVDIARQLAWGLASLHGRGLAHGEIKLTNVRLTETGLAVLVDGGVRPAVCPEVTIHDTLALESYDGIAPELIGTGAVPNASSEIYALGCLLWQLLTGRPPFPMADPLMKLAAHQTQRIVDVRTWAPDTAASVAETIFAMTSPIPNERPRSFEELLNRWGWPGMATRSRLKKYRRTFDGAVPHLSQPGSRVGPSRWPWVAATLLVAAGAALTFADNGLKNQVLAIKQRVDDAIHAYQSNPSTADASPSAAAERPNSPVQVDGLLPLPGMSADGEIVLAEEGPYDGTSKITFPTGKLTIRGARGVNATIRIGLKPLQLAANTVSLINLHVESEKADPASQPAALLFVRSQQLTIQDCEFRRPFDNSESVRDERRLVCWAYPDQVQNAESSESGRIELQNTVWRANGPAIWLGEMPSQILVSNCLKVGSGACFEISPRAPTRATVFDLTRLTLRSSGPLLRLAGRFAEQTQAPAIAIDGNDCVLDVSSANRGLVEVQTDRPRSNLNQAIQMKGSGSIVPAGLNMMVMIDPTGSHSAVPVAGADEQFEGLASSEMEFKGPAAGSAKNSQLTLMTAPRSSANSLPGIDASKLPVPRGK